MNVLEALNKGICPNSDSPSKCPGKLTFIKTGPIVAVCPECGFVCQTFRRNGIPTQLYVQDPIEFDILEDELDDDELELGGPLEKWVKLQRSEVKES